MRAEDRELLRRLADLNQSIGQLTMGLLDDMERGVLPAEGLCLVATEFEALAAKLRHRAADREHHRIGRGSEWSRKHVGKRARKAGAARRPRATVAVMRPSPADAAMSRRRGPTDRAEPPCRPQQAQTVCPTAPWMVRNSSCGLG